MNDAPHYRFADLALAMGAGVAVAALLGLVGAVVARLAGLGWGIPGAVILGAIAGVACLKVFWSVLRKRTGGSTPAGQQVEDGV